LGCAMIMLRSVPATSPSEVNWPFSAGEEAMIQEPADFVWPPSFQVTITPSESSCTKPYACACPPGLCTCAMDVGDCQRSLGEGIAWPLGPNVQRSTTSSNSGVYLNVPQQVHDSRSRSSSVSISSRSSHHSVSLPPSPQHVFGTPTTMLPGDFAAVSYGMMHTSGELPRGSYAPVTLDLRANGLG
jgi:hypothetical protein